MEQPGSTYATFVVRVVRDDAGQLAGIVERVRTGEKARFETTNGMSQLIARMVAGDSPRETERRDCQIDREP
jgi:hypothetical protein